MTARAARTSHVAEKPKGAACVVGPTPLLALVDEPPPQLVIDPPLAGPLAQGRVFIQYRTENLRILPVFGPGALDVSPRIGHLHITVDDAPWHYVDASGSTIVLAGVPSGPHSLLIELADPMHRVLASEAVHFVVPTRNNQTEIDAAMNKDKVLKAWKGGRR